jgi:hypothetical protein
MGLEPEVGDLRLFVIFFTQHDQGTKGCVDFEVGREAEDDPEEGVTRSDVTKGDLSTGRESSNRDFTRPECGQSICEEEESSRKSVRG